MAQNSLTLTTRPLHFGTATDPQAIRERRPELLIFIALLVAFNLPTLFGGFSQNFIFDPNAVHAGQWWRLFTHPFVHVTWYHALLDGLAFLVLYSSLTEVSVFRRMSYVCAAGAGSLLLSWAVAPAISSSGLCGLSGIAHGLMAVSALEMVAVFPAQSLERRLGWISFIIVIGKAAIEGLTGRMLFTFLDFGMVGSPVAVSHPGGIVGSLLALLFLKSAGARMPSSARSD